MGREGGDDGWIDEMEGEKENRCEEERGGDEGSSVLGG